MVRASPTCGASGRPARRDLAVPCRVLLLAVLCFAVAACAAPPGDGLAGLRALEAPFPATWRDDGQGVQRSATLDGRDGPVPVLASIIDPARPLQCVPFARQNSQVKIRGDARTWWRQAAGRYGRSGRPTVGSVLVMKPIRASRGHVAVVTEILNPREIVVDHANWLNRGRIHKGTPVRDVSRNNDWSVVRVWYTPGKRYGANRYPVHGFIDPPVTTAAR